MRLFFKWMLRIAAAFSAISLALIVSGSVGYDFNTMLVSCIGLGLWVWSEYDERKDSGR